MKIVLTTTGTRGDVQPLLALALELKALGHECLFCTPPNFTTWLQDYAFENKPIGIDLEQSTRAASSGKLTPIPRYQLKQVMDSTVRYQFLILLEAARGCDLIVGGGIVQMPTRSIAEALSIPCVFAAFCPVVYPSLQHSPPPMSIERLEELDALQMLDPASLWLNEEQYWNDLYRHVVNTERAKFSLASIDNVMRHTLEGQSLLAADSTVMPLAPTMMYDMEVKQTGAWLLKSNSDLPVGIRQFLDEGDAPIYFGCGSMGVRDEGARIFVEVARSLGKRAVIFKGWSNLQPIDRDKDFLFIDSVAHDQLFPHMAAIVHHGGAGTTMSAVKAGKPQVILPYGYDQFYIADRIQTLGVGAAGERNQKMTVNGLTQSLHDCLTDKIAQQARYMSTKLELNGASVAAEWLTRKFN